MSDDPRFDRELGRAARGLVTEELPRGVLDASLAPGFGSPGVVRGRRSLPALAGIAVALVLLAATAIALYPGGRPPVPTPPPSASPSPTAGVIARFRSTLDIRADFSRLHYACVTGSPLPSTDPSPSAPVREGAICTAPADAGPYTGVVIISEAADGNVVELHAKADVTGGADTTVDRSEIAKALAKAVAVAASGQAVANELADWVLATVPTIEPSLGAGTEIEGFSLKIVRNALGGYQLFMHPV